MREKGPLLPVVVGHQRIKKLCINSNRVCCMKSKAARLILLWNFSVLLSYKMFYDINTYFQMNHLFWLPILMPIVITLLAVLSPVAGFLTDIKFSRIKAVLFTSYAVLVVVISLPIIIIASSLATFRYSLNGYVFPVVASITLFIIVTVYVVFIINAIQFGMDQLHDSPTEDSILYIHWYVWIYYICSLITQVMWNLIFYGENYLTISGISLAGLIVLTTISLLTVSLCVVHYRKVWFFLEPAGINPYKMVYRVVKFAYQHKVPLRRSAFTYCDEESATRLDVGKHKYGGPFTTKQVEDVKTFWGILKVLITIGPAFLLQSVMQTLLPLFAKHNKLLQNATNYHHLHIEGAARYILVSNGLLSPLLVVICIPLYLCWIRPHITYYIP